MRSHSFRVFSSFRDQYATPFDASMREMNRIMDEIEKIYAKRAKK